MSWSQRRVPQPQIFLGGVTVVLVVLMLTVASLTDAAEGPSQAATQQQMNDLKQQVNDLKGDLRQQISELKGITTRLDDTNAWLRGLTAIAGGAAGAIVIALVTGAIAVARLVGKMESRLEGFDKQMERFDTQITRLEDAIRGLEQSRPG
jgi:phage shock protein A